MTSFNLDAFTKALNETTQTPVAETGVSFEGKNLKLNNADDAQVIVDAIKACTNLSYLNLAGNTLGVEASEQLGKALEAHPEFKRALWKDLFTGRLKEEIPKALKFLGAGLVKANARLTELDLSDNAFGPIGVRGLASLLKSSSCYNLKELRLNNNGLGITGGKLLADALTECYECSKAEGSTFALKVFIAGRNRLENEGATVLAKVFQKIGTLEEISMPQNGIYHVGITALSAAFSQNKNLEIINLNDNTIGEKGSQPLAKALLNLKNLRSLNLGDCLLKTKGAEYIAEAIAQKHQNLEYINLESNEIHLSGGIAIANACAHNPNLTQVLLDANQFGSAGPEQIEAIFNEAGLRDVLGTFEDNESDDSDANQESGDETEESEGDKSEEDVEEELSEKEEEEIVIEPVPVGRVVTVVEFLESPSAEKFLALGDERTKQLLAEAKKNPDEDTFLDTFIPVLMKVSALCCNPSPEIVKNALDTTNLLYKELFDWAEQTEQLSITNNTLLVHLGLIKSEDKKFKPTWNVNGCFIAVESVVKQLNFPESTKDALKVFLGRPTDDCTLDIKSKLMNALNMI